MDFTLTEKLPVPREALFPTLRDRVESLPAHMSNVESIQERSRTTLASGVVEREAVWRGAVRAVPEPLRPMVRADMLVWQEHTRWDRDAWTTTWSIQLPILSGVFTARGEDRFLETLEGCAVRIRGELTVHPDEVPPVPGVPRPLLRLMAPQIERFVVRLLDPNLREAPRAAAVLTRWGS